MNLLRRFLLLMSLPRRLRSLQLGTFIECQVDDGGQVYVFIRADDFQRIASVAIAEQRKVLMP